MPTYYSLLLVMFEYGLGDSMLKLFLLFTTSLYMLLAYRNILDLLNGDCPYHSACLTAQVLGNLGELMAVINQEGSLHDCMIGFGHITVTALHPIYHWPISVL